jgi:hypothetical protein
MLAGRISAKMKMENLINVDGALKIVSPRELEVIEKSLSLEENEWENRYLMAENLLGQKAYYVIPKDDGKHYREVIGVNDIVVSENFETWEGNGYTGGHTSNSKWDTNQECNKMYALICQGFIVQDQTREGNVSGYYPKVIYWKVD